MPDFHDGLPDPERVRRWQQLLLDRVANGPDPVFAEIAREVRAGRLTLREAALSPAYQETFAATAQRAMRVAADHSPAEIAEAAAANSIETRIARLTADQQPTPQQPPPTKPEAADEDEPPDSFMVGPPVTDRTNSQPRRERWQRRGS